VSAASIALAVPAVILSATLTFSWGYCVAMVAFWTTKNNAINQFYWTLAWFLGGRIAPLAVLPPALRAAAAVLPFAMMFAFPIEVALGQLAGAELARGFALQLFWVVAGIAAFRLVWNAGLRQYSAVGA
jgi:ABC-2 type transport system permease protein